MDVNWARSLFTVWIFVSFILVLYVVFSKRNKKNHEDAGKSIIQDDDSPR